MASVKINKGAVSADDFFEWLDPSQWPELLEARRWFVKTNMKYDCRQLVRFVAEANEMYSQLGFESAEECLRRLEIDPELASWAVAGLRKLAPDEPVPLDVAVAKGREAVAELAREAVPAKPNGNTGARSVEEHVLQDDDMCFDVIKPRSVTNAGGTSDTYLTSRIARDAPEVLERMKAGEFPSVRKAAIAAGIIDPQRQLEQTVARGIRKLDRDALDRISDIIANRYVELSAKETP